MEPRSIWTLPSQPLQREDLASPILTTIWLFVSLLLTFLLWRLSRSTFEPVKTEFQLTLVASCLLVVWHLMATVDGWLHYDQIRVPYGYIICEPIFEAFRVLSTLFYIWGLFRLIWRVLPERVTGPRIWWWAAKAAFFVVILMAFYYVVLNIAKAIVWLQFFSLNVIADTATKQIHFSITTNALVFGFTLLSAVAVLADWRARPSVDGKTGVFSQKVLLVSAFILFLRSLLEFALVTAAFDSKSKMQKDFKVARVATFGAFSDFYLLCMCVMAYALKTEGVTDTDETRIESNIREAIANELQAETNGRQTEPPSFDVIVDKIKGSPRLDEIIENGSCPLGEKRTREEKREVAIAHCDALVDRIAAMSATSSAHESRAWSMLARLLQGVMSLFRSQRTEATPDPTTAVNEAELETGVGGQPTGGGMPTGLQPPPSQRGPGAARRFSVTASSTLSQYRSRAVWGNRAGHPQGHQLQDLRHTGAGGQRQRGGN